MNKALACGPYDRWRLSIISDLAMTCADADWLLSSSSEQLDEVTDDRDDDRSTPSDGSMVGGGALASAGTSCATSPPARLSTLRLAGGTLMLFRC